MRRLTLGLDFLSHARQYTGLDGFDPAAVAMMAQLAGVQAVRMGVCEDLYPVAERDLQQLRQVTQCLELHMPVSPGLLKVALEVRPDLVVLVGEGGGARSYAVPMDPIGAAGDPSLAPVVRGLEEAGIEVSALVAPELDAVKAAHRIGVRGVELYTGAIVDLPERERRVELDKLADAAQIATRLKLALGIGGGLDLDPVVEVLAAAPSTQRVVTGRSIFARAILLGLDRAIRDFRERLS